MGEIGGVAVALKAEWDLDAWGAAWRAGRVSERTPYGLHKLADEGIDVTWRSLPRLPRMTSVVRVLGATRRRRAPGGDPVVTWDEYAAMRLIGGSDARLDATGLIWATDRPGGGALGRARARALLAAAREARVVWVLSAAQVAPLRAAWPGGPRVEHVPFGIAADFFTPAPPPVKPAVISVGRDRHRDDATLLGALEIVHRERPEVPLFAQVRRGAALPPGVRPLPLLGHDALRDAYHRSSVLVVATRPNLHVSGMTAALEAMASARPVVLSRTPGAEDYVEDGVTGALVAPGDARAHAWAVLDALDAGTIRERGAAARRSVERTFTTDALAGRLAALLRG